MNILDHTWAAKSTHIFEKEVRRTCSYLSFGKVVNPVFFVAISYSFTTNFHDIGFPLYLRENNHCII